MLRLQKYAEKDEKFIVINRSNYNLAQLTIKKENIHIIEKLPMDISSTQIRELINNHDNGFQAFLPQSIVDYIAVEQLYLN